MRELVEDNISLALDRAEKEREYLSQRTKEGLQKAKEEGKVLGTKPKAKLNVKKAAAAKAVSGIPKRFNKNPPLDNAV